MNQLKRRQRWILALVLSASSVLTFAGITGATAHHVSIESNPLPPSMMSFSVK